MFGQLKLTCRGMFHCTFSNNWPKLATLADNGAKNKRDPKTPVAQGRRDLLACWVYVHWAPTSTNTH